MKRGIGDSQLQSVDALWLTGLDPRDTPGVLTLQPTGPGAVTVPFKVPRRLWRHMTTLASMFEDLQASADTEVAVPLPLSGDVLLSLFGYVNVLDMWAALPSRAQSELVSNVGGVVGRNPDPIGYLLDQLTVINYLDCQPVMSAMRECLLAQFKTRSRYVKKEDLEQIRAELADWAPRLQGGLVRPIDLVNTDPSAVVRLNDARIAMAKHATPDDVQQLILQELLPRQRPSISYCVASTYGVIVSPHGHTAWILGRDVGDLMGAGPGRSETVPRLFYENRRHQVLSVGCGLEHCVLLTTGGLFGLGARSESQYPLYDSPSEVRGLAVALDTDGLTGRPLAVACGAYFTLVLTDDGVFGCGSNAFGQLARNPDKTPKIDKFMRLSYGLRGVPRRIACGDAHTMILTDDGLFVCGKDDDGQLGIGGKTGGVSRVYQLTALSGSVFSPPERVISFAAGDTHSVVLTRDGLYASGRPFAGGRNVKGVRRMQPIITRHLGELAGATCGGRATYVWTTKGSCYAAGALRDYDEPDDFTEVYTGESPVVDVACGFLHALICTGNGDIYQTRLEGFLRLVKVQPPEILYLTSRAGCRQCGNNGAMLTESAPHARAFCDRDVCQTRYYDSLRAACERLDKMMK